MMTADIYRDGFIITWISVKGKRVAGKSTTRKIGSAIRWKPDAEVFTDINAQ
ncbi:MAG: hypothetical protein ACLR7U_08480 [Ruthenibacterium lactatiformans]